MHLMARALHAYQGGLCVIHAKLTACGMRPNFGVPAQEHAGPGIESTAPALGFKVFGSLHSVPGTERFKVDVGS